MRAQLEAFKREVRVVLQHEAPEIVAKAQRELCLSLIDALAAGTPVDTGYLRINWQLDRASIPSGTIDGERLKARGKARISEGDADALAKRVLDTAGEKLAGMTVPDIVHIINNVEYLIYLEEGRVEVDREVGSDLLFGGQNKKRVLTGSTQQPDGWIAHTLEVFRAQWSDLIEQKMGQVEL